MNVSAHPHNTSGISVETRFVTDSTSVHLITTGAPGQTRVYPTALVLKDRLASTRSPRGRQDGLMSVPGIVDEQLGKVPHAGVHLEGLVDPAAEVDAVVME